MMASKFVNAGSNNWNEVTIEYKEKENEIYA